MVEYLRANAKFGFVDRRNLFVQVGVGLEFVQGTSLGRGVAVPNNLFALATTRLFLCGFLFACFLFSFSTKDVGTRSREVAQRRNNICTYK